MEIAEFRRDKLKEWFSVRPMPAKEKSYLCQLMKGRGSFGEKAARRLEETYGMPRGYLDGGFDIEKSSKAVKNAVRSEEDVLLDSLTEKISLSHRLGVVSKKTLEGLNELFDSMLSSSQNRKAHH